MKRSISFLLSICLIVALYCAHLEAAPPLTVQVNGSIVQSPAHMDIVEGQVMVPLRWGAEQLGVTSVQWDAYIPTNFGW